MFESAPDPAVSILVVTWNSWNDLDRLLRSIRALRFRDYEVLVIDNGSVDATPEKVEKSYPEVRLVRNPENVGLPGAVNRGFALVRGRYVMVLDVDTEVDSDAVSHLLGFLESHPTVSLAAPRIHTPQGDVEESARSFPSFMSGLFGRRAVLTRLFPRNRFSRSYLRRENLEQTDPFRVEQVSAACMFLRRELIEEAGPWDEAFRCYWVDTDWCKRLARIGKRIYCVPSARVVHFENNRVGKRKSPWRIWQFHMGAYRLYRKHDTLGAADPRALVALAALTARAGLLLVSNTLAGLLVERKATRT
jgi:hypothetical protein